MYRLLRHQNGLKGEGGKAPICSIGAPFLKLDTHKTFHHPSFWAWTTFCYLPHLFLKYALLAERNVEFSQ